MLGNVIEQALTSVGVTKERVERWLGGKCNCEERRERLNALHSWAVRVIVGRKTDKAKEHLESLIEP